MEIMKISSSFPPWDGRHCSLPQCTETSKEKRDITRGEADDINSNFCPSFDCNLYKLDRSFPTYSPVSTGIFPHSLPEWAFRARPGLWRICLCPKVARIAEHKFANH